MVVYHRARLYARSWRKVRLLGGWGMGPGGAGVIAAGAQKFIRGTKLRDLAVLKNDDSPGVTHRGKAMGGHDGCTVGDEASQALDDGGFGFGIESAGGFVKEQDGSAFQEGPGD